MTVQKLLQTLKDAVQSPEIVEVIGKQLHLTPTEIKELYKNSKSLWLALSPDEKKRLLGRLKYTCGPDPQDE